jgi:hypothetical protein
LGGEFHSGLLSHLQEFDIEEPPVDDHGSGISCFDVYRASIRGMDDPPFDLAKDNALIEARLVETARADNTGTAIRIRGRFSLFH